MSLCICEHISEIIMSKLHQIFLSLLFCSVLSGGIVTCYKFLVSWMMSCFPIMDPIGRISYIRIYLLFLFPVKDSKFSTGVNATFNASCYG